jgi:hypothetical protein
MDIVFPQAKNAMDNVEKHNVGNPLQENVLIPNLKDQTNLWKKVYMAGKTVKEFVSNLMRLVKGLVEILLCFVGRKNPKSVAQLKKRIKYENNN